MSDGTPTHLLGSWLSPNKSLEESTEGLWLPEERRDARCRRSFNRLGGFVPYESLSSNCNGILSSRSGPGPQRHLLKITVIIPLNSANLTHSSFLLLNSTGHNTQTVVQLSPSSSSTFNKLAVAGQFVVEEVIYQPCQPSDCNMVYMY